MEIIEFKNEEDFFEVVNCENEDYFEYKEEKLSRFDSEKGTVNVQCFFSRESDGKKFTAFYVRGGQGDEWADEYKLTEVVTRKKVDDISWKDIEAEFLAQEEEETVFAWLQQNYKTPKKI